MSPQQQDVDALHKHRQRSNTTTFAPFANWRRNKAETSIAPAPQAQSISVEDLIEHLTPPAVPKPANARALASALSAHSPLPKPASLNSILASLCAFDSPSSLQSAGYDILSAYWDHQEAVALTVSDRMDYFSLFLGDERVSWSQELWEPRFKALRALTKTGTEVVGLEVSFLDLLKRWIEGAFEGLFPLDLVDHMERSERERSIDAMTTFLASVMENQDIVSRVPDEELMDVLSFYATLLQRSLDVHSDSMPYEASPSPEYQAPSTSTPPRSYSHRRHPSSVSIPPQATQPPPPKHPAGICVTVYLQCLATQLKTLSPSHLNSILPVLFRSLAFYASPLPRLTITTVFPSTSSPEDRITETLNSLFTGPYSTSCMIVLKQHLFPPSASSEQNIMTCLEISTGAHRTLRNYIRRGLCTRLARAYISRESSMAYTPSGAPGHMDLERDLMERAWPKDDVSGWDPAKLGRILSHSVEKWIDYNFGLDIDLHEFVSGREKLLDEAAGTLKDILQELDMREDDLGMDEEEACAVGEALYTLASYVHPLKTPDGTPFIVPIMQPTDAPTPFLRTLSSLLSREHTMYMVPLLSTTLLSVADHLTDIDTSKLPQVMFEQHDLSPTSSDWLNNWRNILVNHTLLSQQRPLTRQAIMSSLQSVYGSVKDMPSYRMPLADLVHEFCRRQVETEKNEAESGGDVLWSIIGDEIVLRTVEVQNSPTSVGNASSPALEDVENMVNLLRTAATGSDEDDDNDTVSVATTDTHSPSPLVPFSVGSSALNSPVLSRMQSEFQSKDKESAMPSVMSLLSSFATGNSSRSQSQHPQAQDDQSFNQTILTTQIYIPKAVYAVAALVSIFTQLAFTPNALSQRNLDLAIRVYGMLVGVLSTGWCTKARLAVLQFLTRLRADRDHRLYFVGTNNDPDGHTAALSSLIQRGTNSAPKESKSPSEEPSSDDLDLHKMRMRANQERDGRRTSRGRGTRPSTSASSRSRSRATPTVIQNATSPQTVKPREILWRIPDSPPFTLTEALTPSEGLISYHPDGPDPTTVLPVSAYLLATVSVLEKEKDWEILSYILCHLPVQLSNKHLFCGPKSRDVIAKLVAVLSKGIVGNTLASEVDYWPNGLKARDAHGLAYHTLSILISYRRCLDVKLRHLLVEVFERGLDEQPSTTRCCLHALTLSAFEFPASMTKRLSRILEKLSRIMSNPDMAVHIIGFLSIVGSLNELHANFTEADFKMVFGVALQYLQQHPRSGSTPTISWALSEHVRIMSYYLVYIWFLAVKLPDRPLHIRFITRQLLLANEGNGEVDEPTEVCFDWLARYTYATADPRPATKSVLNEIIMSAPSPKDTEVALSEKNWILGNSIVTIRTLVRLGWIEVVSRRPSGVTKFLCKAENVPLVGPGDVNPDTVSIPALLMDQHLSETSNPVELTQENVSNTSRAEESPGNIPPSPDTMTGYVWSGSAPSQRRKEVCVDPSYFALQLSSYPASVKPTTHNRKVNDTASLPRLFNTLERTPVIDTHTVGILYVAPGQSNEIEILRNTHGSPAYTRFLEGLGRLIDLRGQLDIYIARLASDENGDYAYAWWDDIGQTLYHTATMMPTLPGDDFCVNKKRHIGNDNVRIVWNDSGKPYRFDTLATEFQFVNIIIEPHSFGAIAAFSNNLHETEYFKVTVQRAPGMTEFAPVGDFKLISAENLPLLVRQLGLLADWYTTVFISTEYDTKQVEVMTHWRSRLRAIKRFKEQMPIPEVAETDGLSNIMRQEAARDFTASY